MKGAIVISLLAASGVAWADAPEPTLVAAGEYFSPRFSPDGASLLATDQRMHRVWVIDARSGRARAVADEPRAGVTARFLPDGRIAFEASRAGAVRTVAIGGDGVARGVELPAAAAFAHGDRIYVRTAGGIVPVGSGDRFFGPTVSPDGNRVAFVGLATGIHVYDLTTGALERLGPGTAPAWSPDSAALAFERTEDDGHDIVASDVWIWRPGAPARPLTATDRRLERRPAWSPDGARIAFDDDAGAIYVLEIGGAR